MHSKRRSRVWRTYDFKDRRVSFDRAVQGGGSVMEVCNSCQQKSGAHEMK